MTDVTTAGARCDWCEAELMLGGRIHIQEAGVAAAAKQVLGEVGPGGLYRLAQDVIWPFDPFQIYYDFLEAHPIRALL